MDQDPQVTPNDLVLVTILSDGEIAEVAGHGSPKLVRVAADALDDADTLDAEQLEAGVVWAYNTTPQTVTELASAIEVLLPGVTVSHEDDGVRVSIPDHE